VPPGPPISYSLLWPPRSYLVTIKNNEAPYYSVSSSLLLLPMDFLFSHSYFLPEDGGGNSLRNVIILGCYISVSVYNFVRSRNSSVGVEIRLRTGRLSFGQLIPGARNFSCPKSSNRLWVPRSLLFSRHQRKLPGRGCGLKGLGRENDHSLPYSAEEGNEWSYSSPSPHAIVMCVGTNLPFSLHHCRYSSEIWIYCNTLHITSDCVLTCYPTYWIKLP
jgi:hypothetical protein